jgi:2-phosphosulfolactate phosphatase
MPIANTVSVHLLPALLRRESIRGSCVIVLDVLRATSVMVHALVAGCEQIIPCLEIDDALRVRDGLPAGATILGGERHGLPIPGFDLGNSPSSYSPEVCLHKTLVMTTTNGTKAILAALEANRVLIASFGNFEATCDAAARTASADVHVLCAGTEGDISHEDTLLAGAIVANLSRSESGRTEILLGNDSARIARSHWILAEQAMRQGRSLESILASGRGGTRVREIGLADDITEAARLNHLPVVAELRRDPLRIVSATS